MKVEVSVGEVIDKLSILELKYKKILNVDKRAEIKNEIDILLSEKECVERKCANPFYYKLLMYVNEKIWDMTDVVKKTAVEDPNFAIVSNQIFNFNQKRFRIKNWFNLITNSNIKEQKSYSTKCCHVVIENADVFYAKLNEINFLSIEYDFIMFSIQNMDASIVKNIFGFPTIVEDLTPTTTIFLKDFEIDADREIFEFPPISYIAGGMFGDFIQSLSVINEIWINTGRQGILYIAEKGDVFRNGLQNTYDDTKIVLKNQRYIKEYNLYNDEPIDIDLTVWRNNPKLYKVNWHNLFKDTYGVEWGKHAWIDVPINNEWSDKILINTVHYRWCYNVDFKLLNELHPGKLVFISSDANQYIFFIKTTGLKIHFYKFENFYDLCVAIKSCKMFVGSLSAPLAIAHACKKNRIIGLCKNPDDNMCNFDLV